MAGVGADAAALLAAALIAILAALGGLRGWLGRPRAARPAPGVRRRHAGARLRGGDAPAQLARGARSAGTPPALVTRRVAGLLALGALWFATGSVFQAEVASVRLWLGGSAEARRQALVHQVYAAYRRADRDAVLLVLERSRVYEPTVHAAAADAGLITFDKCCQAFDGPRDVARGATEQQGLLVD